MTKEEYERLLKSDYWKGYSYSLIKERDFTCEDCGRRFYNERNKLQVHHLVYRDVNPWSYRPDEVVVLCEDCHKKRHGIFTESVADSLKQTNDTYSWNERSTSTTDIHLDTSTFNSNDKIDSQFTWPEKEEKRFKFKYVIYGLLILIALAFGYEKLQNGEQINEPVEEFTHDNETQKFDATDELNKRSVAKKKGMSTKQNLSSDDAIPVISEYSTIQSNVEEEKPMSTTQKAVAEPREESSSVEGLSTAELLERRAHANVVEQAKRAGVSTEGSTSDILERITHANVVEQGKRAGVSTEGSTSDILERITHANVVEQGKRAGVSTEGSTSDILERITHANVVKQAKRAGVSTEGSTSDILERITHANVVKQAKRAGVSTEGSTSDILERITRKRLESK